MIGKRRVLFIQTVLLADHFIFLVFFDISLCFLFNDKLCIAIFIML